MNGQRRGAFFVILDNVNVDEIVFTQVGVVAPGVDILIVLALVVVIQAVVAVNKELQDRGSAASRLHITDLVAQAVEAGVGCGRGVGDDAQNRVYGVGSVGGACGHSHAGGIHRAFDVIVVGGDIHGDSGVEIGHGDILAGDRRVIIGVDGDAGGSYIAGR